MTEPAPPLGAPSSLVLDFLAWLSQGPRSYVETMEVWRTSCPRLTVWEDAVDAGWVTRRLYDGCANVVLSDAGRRRLERND